MYLVVGGGGSHGVGERGGIPASTNKRVMVMVIRLVARDEVIFDKWDSGRITPICQCWVFSKVL